MKDKDKELPDRLSARKGKQPTAPSAEVIHLPIKDKNPSKGGAYRGKNPNGERGLTAKQEAFAVAVANGATLSDAYRSSYNVGEKASVRTVWNNASKLADDSRVAARITAEVERLEREKPHDDAATRRILRELFLTIAQSPTAKHSDRLRAAELLGKVDGVSLFTGSTLKDKGDNSPGAGDLKELEKKLVSLLKGQAVDKAS